jgi:hypothetical protein
VPRSFVPECLVRGGLIEQAVRARERRPRRGPTLLERPSVPYDGVVTEEAVTEERRRPGRCDGQMGGRREGRIPSLSALSSRSAVTQVLLTALILCLPVVAVLCARDASTKAIIPQPPWAFTHPGE